MNRKTAQDRDGCAAHEPNVALSHLLIYNTNRSGGANQPRGGGSKSGAVQKEQAGPAPGNYPILFSSLFIHLQTNNTNLTGIDRKIVSTAYEPKTI